MVGGTVSWPCWLLIMSMYSRNEYLKTVSERRLNRNGLQMQLSCFANVHGLDKPVGVEASECRTSVFNSQAWV